MMKKLMNSLIISLLRVFSLEQNPAENFSQYKLGYAMAF